MTPLQGDRGGITRILRASLSGRRTQVFGVLAWSLVEAVPAYLSGRLVERAVDHGFLVHRPGTGLAWLSVLGVTLFAGGWATRQVYPQLAGLVEPFRDGLVALTVSSALRRSTEPGGRSDNQALARLTRQVEIAREAYAALIAVVLGFSVSTVSALIGLANLLPAATVLVLPPLLVGLGLFFASVGKLSARQRDSILADENLSEATAELVDGQRDIVASGGEKIVESAVSEHIVAQAATTKALARLTAVRNLAVSVGGLLPVVLVLVDGPSLVRHGATIGAVLGVLTYLLSGIHPALQTFVRGLGPSGIWLIVSLRRLLEAADSVDLTRAANSMRAAASPGGPNSPSQRRGTRRPGDIRLEQVTFSYGCAPLPVIQELNLSVPDGDHLAVVGPSGIGKSTLAGLVSGLLAPQSGEVLIGGKNLARLSPEALVRERVLIPEEAYVFSAPLIDNIRYFRENAPIRQVDLAVDQLGARHLIERLGGYKAAVDPHALSAGERQLIAAVRAFLSPCPLVILDEATCHLDSAAEARIERAFARRPGTLIVIAHRMSSALRARRVVVMGGESIVVGKHRQLLDVSPLYRDLVGCWTGSGRPVVDGSQGATTRIGPVLKGHGPVHSVGTPALEPGPNGNGRDRRPGQSAPDHVGRAGRASTATKGR